MAAYVIFNYKITDRSRIDEIAVKEKSVNIKYGAKVIVASPVKTIEGSAYPNMVIYEFKDLKSAQNWYYSEEYKNIMLFRNSITEGWATIVPAINETASHIETKPSKLSHNDTCQ